METAILIIGIVMLCISGICLAYTIKIANSINGNDDKKIDELRESMYNEFSRNRSEQNQSAVTQRKELEAKLTEVNATLDNIKTTNQEQLMRIFREISVGLGKIDETNVKSAERQNLKIENALEKIRESNEQKLDQMRNVVDEKLTSTLTQRLDSSFKTVSDQLENLYKALGEMKEMSGGITEHVTSLNRVLSNVKARGTWAEVQLKNILDQTIPNMYVENYAPSKTSKDRVEFAIKIPSGDNYSEITYLPLDSKFPMEDYVRLCEATDRSDADASRAARKALEDRVINEARMVTKYISVPKTTPFAIMYLASEGLYAEIASSANAIPERLQREFNIMIAGPSTITALLNSLSLGFRIAAINEKANEVRKILSAVKSQYDTFSGVLAKAKKKIDEAGKSLDEAQHRNDMIQKRLRSIEAIDISESDEVLEISDGNTTLDEE
ncbi:MAG: DNA recombination protein RmuC [Ruminococcaceae bacterium]|nr:DNA recombination protein RmuC [Oscillospiraceae bacterium]